MTQTTNGGRIYAAISDAFVFRMRNWAAANSGAGVYLTSSAFTMAGRDTYGDKGPAPVQIGEAEDTGNALAQLPVDYRQAVCLFWQYEGQSLAYLARRCGGIDYRTYERRVMAGHEALRIEVTRRHEVYLAYRAGARRTLVHS